LQVVCQWGTNLPITNERDFHGGILLSAERPSSPAAMQRSGIAVRWSALFGSNLFITE
jgi:hypothetical protein